MDFDGYDIVRPEEGQPRPKYISYSVRFGVTSTPNFKAIFTV